MERSEEEKYEDLLVKFLYKHTNYTANIKENKVSIITKISNIGKNIFVCNLSTFNNVLKRLETLLQCTDYNNVKNAVDIFIDLYSTELLYSSVKTSIDLNKLDTWIYVSKDEIIKVTISPKLFMEALIEKYNYKQTLEKYF